jgi:hypothetical protein
MGRQFEGAVMKHGNFWMTTIGTGLLIAGMMIVGRTAMQSPAMLFLAGQLKVAVGKTEDGIRLMNQAATKEEAGTVHAAEPVAKPTEVCSKIPSSAAIPRRPETAKVVKSIAKPLPAAVVFAKLELPQPPVANIDPTTFRYLTEQQRHEIHAAQKEFQKAQRERLSQIRRETRAGLGRVPAVFPADFSTLHLELPASLGQMAQ